MLKRIFAVALVLFMGMQLQAQTQDAPKNVKQTKEYSVEKRADRMANALGQDLQLSEEQVAKVKEIEMKFTNTMIEYRKSADRSNMGEQVMELRKQKNEDIKAVLTPEQQEQYKELRREKMGSRSAEMRKKRNEMHMERVKERRAKMESQEGQN